MIRLRNVVLETALGLIVLSGLFFLFSVSRNGVSASYSSLSGWWILRAIPSPAKVLLCLDLAATGWALGWATRAVTRAVLIAAPGYGDDKMPGTLKDLASWLVVVQLGCAIVLRPEFRGRWGVSALLPGNQHAGIWSGFYVEGDIWLTALAVSALSLAVCQLSERAVGLAQRLLRR